MDSESWIGRSAQQIADAVRRGEAQPRRVVQQHLDRIERLNPQLGAFRKVRHEEALAEADALAARSDLGELPLAGVPVAIKDNVPVAGEQTRNGSSASSEATNESDHPVVARLRAAGAIVVGLTNVPELCLMPMSDSVYGIARNPWNRQTTSGGSSGGSATAVSAALVPIAHGNDGLGSIRIPASLCGLVGIKPGAGVVPPLLNEDGSVPWYGLSENGPLATTVRDAALALSVMADDPELAELDDAASNGADSSGLDSKGADSKTVRVGVSVRPTQLGLPIDHRCEAAVIETGDLLASVGHTVSRHTARYPMWLGPAALRTWFSCAHEDARKLDHTKLDRSTRQMAAIGRVLNAAHFGGGGARERWRSGAADAFLGDVDVLVLPAVAVPPPFARRYGERAAVRNAITSVLVGQLLGPWNIAGWPAMNVPAGVHDPGGWPLGVQLVARPGGEQRLLALAAQLEAARPWARHAPEYAV
ncbi:amidase [Actinocrinis sp.]|uniref:amidase n=1 Tax=Actinocrinis sp. TaxID=1920516 RepID=UPI002D59CF19|nr:amidase family protein [Actinocrinis sp.]HZP55114.1 amidase family protein [Actinocrinis sp.]